MHDFSRPHTARQDGCCVPGLSRSFAHAGYSELAEGSKGGRRLEPKELTLATGPHHHLLTPTAEGRLAAFASFCKSHSQILPILLARHRPRHGGSIFSSHLISSHLVSRIPYPVSRIPYLVLRSSQSKGGSLPTTHHLSPFSTSPIL